MYIHIHIYAYRRTPVDAEPSIHARIYIHTYAHARGDGLQPNADGAADARVRAHMWASVHASRHKRPCTFVQMGIAQLRARIHTRTCARSHGIDSHTHTNTCTRTYVRRCMHLVIHVSWARACAAPDARSHARTNTHTRSHGIYTHAHMHVHALKRRHTRMVTPI